MAENNSIRRGILVAILAALVVSLVPSEAEAFGSRQDRGAAVAEALGSNRGNIVAKLDRLGDFTILKAALDTAGLTETLATGGPFTLFAPTDAAFVALLDELNITAEQLLENPDLENILLYHVVAGRQQSGFLVGKSVNETLFEERPVLVTREKRRVKVNGINVTQANLGSGNGVIHVIDGVLLPPDQELVENIVDVLRLDGRFSVLVTALEMTGLDAALSGESELTLFAPTDEAFTTLLNTLGISAADLLANPDLPDILLYHVAAGSRSVFDLLSERNVETLQGDSVFVNFGLRNLAINDSNVINPTIKAPNGGILTIDAVLLP